MHEVNQQLNWICPSSMSIIFWKHWSNIQPESSFKIISGLSFSCFLMLNINCNFRTVRLANAEEWVLKYKQVIPRIWETGWRDFLNFFDFLLLISGFKNYNKTSENSFKNNVLSMISGLSTTLWLIWVSELYKLSMQHLIVQIKWITT